jgi:hypothetical protein
MISIPFPLLQSYFAVQLVGKLLPLLKCLLSSKLEAGRALPLTAQQMAETDLTAYHTFLEGMKEKLLTQDHQ